MSNTSMHVHLFYAYVHAYQSQYSRIVLILS